MGDSVIPLVHFTHAELKNSANLNARLDSIKVSAKKSSSFKSIAESSAASSQINGHHHHHHHSKRLKLTIHDEDMDYEGTEEDDCPFMVGVVPKDGSNDRISLLNTAYFVMKPECYLSQPADKDGEEKSAPETTSYSDKLNLLTAAFGSSRKRKAMQTKLKNKIDSETLEVAVDTALKESRTTQQGEEENEASEEKPNKAQIEQFLVLPVPNEAAKTPQDCYPLLDVFKLTQEEFEKFTGPCSISFAETTVDKVKEWAKNGSYPEFICDRLLEIGASKIGHKQKMIKFRLLSFMYYLITMFRMKQSQLKGRTPLVSAQVPDQAIKKLYELYTISSGGGLIKKAAPTMPNRLRDKLAAHILILAWHIDDFSSDFRPFQKDLKMSVPRLTDFYQSLGASFSNQISMNVEGKKIMVKKAELKLPLPNLALILEPKKTRKPN